MSRVRAVSQLSLSGAGSGDVRNALICCIKSIMSEFDHSSTILPSRTVRKFIQSMETSFPVCGIP